MTRANSIFFLKYRIVSSLVLPILTIVLIVTMAIISLVYIIFPKHEFFIHFLAIGIIGWITIFCATIYLSLGYLSECLLIFVVFSVFGFSTKAYLEPISDQLDHLHRTYERCDNINYYGTKFNTGFWQYNMNGVLLCNARNIANSPANVLRKIDFLHAIYTGLASVVIFLIGRISGLPKKWSLLALCIAIFFMGTDKFSYFRYYSYGPSFTSMLMFWTWLGVFLFKKSRIRIFLGIISASLLVIILSVNHLQETVFLVFTLIIWVILNVTEKIFIMKNNKIFMFLWLMLIFLFFYVFPQFQIFQNFLKSLFLTHLWENNQNVILYWNKLHIFGKIWDQQLRVINTPGIMGQLPVVLLFFVIFWDKCNIERATRIRISLLGILPFLIISVPFFHYIWVSNVYLEAYYRIMYSSLFWYIIAVSFYFFELSIENNNIKIIYYILCVVFVVSAGMIRSKPFYGKIDFFLLNGRPWWPSWEVLVRHTRREENTYIYTDPITSYVLNGIFGEKTIINIEAKSFPKLYLEDMEAGKLPEKIFLNLSLKSSKKTEDYRCIVNLIGYQSSWVPKETHHWDSNIANTFEHYRFISTESSSDIFTYLKHYQSKRCKVYLPTKYY